MGDEKLGVSLSSGETMNFPVRGARVALDVFRRRLPALVCVGSGEAQGDVVPVGPSVDGGVSAPMLACAAEREVQVVEQLIGVLGRFGRVHGCR